MKKKRLNGSDPQTLRDFVSYGDPDQIETTDTDWERIGPAIKEYLSTKPNVGRIMFFGTTGQLDNKGLKDGVLKFTQE